MTADWQVQKKLISYSYRLAKKIYLVASRFKSKWSRGKSDTGIVVYHAMTVYQILLCTVDKMLNPKNRDGILIISVYLVSRYPHYRDLLEAKVFKEVLVYDIDNYSKADEAENCEQTNNKLISMPC